MAPPFKLALLSGLGSTFFSVYMVSGGRTELQTELQKPLFQLVKSDISPQLNLLNLVSSLSFHASDFVGNEKVTFYFIFCLVGVNLPALHM